MGRSNLRGLLAFSAILALGSASGRTKPALPDSPLQHGAPERVSGKVDQAAADPQDAETPREGRKGGSEAKRGGKEPPKPAQRPAQPETEKGAPAREEKSDCDDCVIVLPEATDDSCDPEGGTAGSSDLAGSAHLAGTLWGLFMVARPKRMPRTIIRGVTVP